MAMLSTETKKKLEDKIDAYHLDFLKYSRLAWAASGNTELERKHLKAALERAALRDQVQAELKQLRGSNNPPLGGAFTRPSTVRRRVVGTLGTILSCCPSRSHKESTWSCEFELHPARVWSRA